MSTVKRDAALDAIKSCVPYRHWVELNDAFRNRALNISGATKLPPSKETRRRAMAARISQSRVSQRMSRTKHKALLSKSLKSIKYKDFADGMKGFDDRSGDDNCTKLLGSRVRIVFSGKRKLRRNVEGYVVDISKNTVVLIRKGDIISRYAKRGTKFALVQDENTIFWGDQL